MLFGLLNKLSQMRKVEDDMKKIPKEITLCKLECVLMPQGEILCLGKTIGWFKDLKSYLEKAGNNNGGSYGALNDEIVDEIKKAIKEDKAGE